MTDQTKPGFAPSRLLPIIAIGLVAVAGLYFLGDRISFETLRDNREALLAWRDANYLLAALAYALIYVAIVAFSLPGASIATITGGFLFGLAAGTGLTVVAATVGATVIFLAARWGLGDTLAARMDASEGTAARLKAALRENEISVLFLMRLVPAVPFFIANLIPGLVGVRLRNYVLTTFLGIIPGTAVYTWIGVGLGEVFAAGGTPDLSIIWQPHIIGPILGLAALAALPIAIKAVRGRSALPVSEVKE
ncbi:MAG: TVP38/TMEM64 family protein [Rubricella sp.]